MTEISAGNALGATGGLRSALTSSVETKPEAVVGVHIDTKCIRVAVVADSCLVLHKQHPLPEGVGFADAKFAPILRKILDEACARHRRVDIWAAASLPDTHLHHIRIPRVPVARIMSAVRWAVSKDRPCDEKTTILDMDVEGEVVEEGVNKIAVTAYTMPRETVNEMQNVFRSVGYPATGITLPFFALRNLFKSRWVAPSNEAVLHMHVGFHYSRISIISNGIVILTRGIKTGFNALLDAVRDGAGGAISPMQVGNLLSTLDAGQASSLSEKEAASGAGEDVLKMVQPVLIRIVRQIEQTMASQIARQNTGQDKMLYISGEICGYRRIVEFIQEHIGIGIQTINPLKSNMGAPAESDIEAVMFAPAVGLALADASRTPNALLTMEQRFLVKRSDNFVRMALVVMIVLALGMAGAAHVMHRMAAKKKAEIVRLRSELDAAGPVLNVKALAEMTAKSVAQRERMVQIVRRTAAVSVLGELSRLTPTQIKLTGVALEMEPPESVGATRTAEGDKARANVLTLKGVVRSGRDSPDSVVAAYAVELEKSPIFDEVAVQQRDAKVDTGEGLQFAIKVVLASQKQNPGR